MAAVQHYARLNYDIWSYISSFFTFEELWAMRFLNDVVLDVALDAAYDWVVVPTNHYDFEGFGQWFSSFYGPDVAHRVRTLHIHSLLSTRAFNWIPDSSATETTIPDEKALTFYYKILQQTSLGPAIKVKTGFPLQERALLSVLSRFSTVSKLLELNQNSSGEEALLPRLAIKATARTLAYLCIDAPFNMVAHILPDSPLLPNLETLSMFLEWDNVLCAEISVDAQIQNLATFINRNADSLLSLSLRLPMEVSEVGSYPAPPSTSDPYLSSIYERLEIHLVSLHFYLTRETDPCGLRYFLEQQSKSLKELEVRLETNLSYIGKDQALKPVLDSFKRVSILKSLCIEYVMDEHQAKLTEDFEEPCTRIANAFRLIQISLEFFLTSLDLKGRIELLPDELSQLLRMTSINRLEHLALPFKVFTADMFDLIVLRLPALRSFELKVNTCKGQYSEGDNNDCHWEWEFANDMKQRSYTKWGLKSFYLIKGSRSRMQGICFEAVARRIVQALPNVQTFNGSSSGADYLSRFPNPHLFND